MTQIKIAARGFVIVALVAWNVRHVAAGAYLSAALTGGAISVVWWLNAGLAAQARADKWACLSYGAGAACGTAFGVWLGS